MVNLSPDTEPMAIWATHLVVFDKSLSLTQNVVMTQGRQALYALVKRIDRLYELLNESPQIIDCYLSPEIPYILTEVFTHQGTASSILFNSSPRASGEGARSYKLRIERFEYVRDICDQAQLSRSILTNRTLRNQLIHIDSYIEKAMRTPYTGWSIDTAMAYRDQYQAPNGMNVGFCRTFIVSEEKLLHFGHEISIKGLRREAENVLNAVFGNPLTPPPKPPAHSRQGQMAGSPRR
jgi:hypothetical protein